MTAHDRQSIFPPGARWWKFDFHTHTPASADYGKGSDREKARKIVPEEWLLGFMRAGIDCVAVTDHNSGDWIDRLKTALLGLDPTAHADFRPLHLFPGVEITANGGTHVLGLFDTDAGSADVNAVLGAVGYHGVRGQSDRAADESPIHVVQAIAEHGGIAILAHVDGPAGAWERLPGDSLAPLLDCPELFAMEVVDGASPPPEIYRQRRLAWAEVLGSDAHHATGAAGQRFPGSRFTWVKMEKPRLEGLRLALLDGPGFAIRRSDDAGSFDPNRLPEHYTEAIEIGEARYIGRRRPQRLEFSPWLNALVGGRGTGKSTVVHALRLAARRDAEMNKLSDHSQARRTFERFNRVPSQRIEQGGLTRETALTWIVRRQGVRYRIHWRNDAEGVVVEEDAGKDDWRASSVQIVDDRRFPLRIFSQGQIGELAGDDQQALLGVIDDAVGATQWRRDLEAAENEFRSLRAQVRQLDAQLAARDGLVVEREDTVRKLARFEEGRHRAILAAYQRRSRQQQEIERQLDVAAGIADRIVSIAQELRSEDVPAGTFDDSPEDAAAGNVVAAVAAAIGKARTGLQKSAKDLGDVLAVQRRTLETSAWNAVARQAEEDYRALVEDLQAEGIADPSEYGHLVQDRTRLDGELAVLDSLSERRDHLSQRAEDGLDRIRECRRAVSVARERFLADALAGNRFVRIAVDRYGNDPRVIERSMREALNVLDERFTNDILTPTDAGNRGCVAVLLDDLPTGREQRGREVESRIGEWKKRVREASAGKQSGFGRAFANYLRRETERSPALLDGLLAWFPDDALRVEYSPKGDGGEFRPISQASAGQRAAAMLAFLLAHGDEPLVLDQPEDDLDNHLIYDLVVRQMRENKRRRQIVVVTHNPNIVVNGDAEMLHALDFRQGQCIVTRSGSLQDPAMRDEVCRIMEGGREAFERRYRRLGRD